MPTTIYKGYSVPTTGTESGTWGTDLNTNTFAVIDTNLGGITTITVSNVNVTLTATQAQNMIIRIVGALTGSLIVVIPAVGLFAVQNATTGAAPIYVGGSAGSMQFLPQGMSTMVEIDSVNGASIAGQRTSTVGMVAPFVGQTVPSGWLHCDGSLVSRILYASLWTFAQASGNIQTEANWSAGGYWGAFSTGDGTTNFRIPDLRGWFPRAWAQAKPYPDPGRICGTQQVDYIAGHNHPASVSDPAHRHQEFASVTDGAGAPALTSSNHPDFSQAVGNYYSDYTIHGNAGDCNIGLSGSSGTGISVTTGTSGTAGPETRPVNVALMYCISIA